MTSKHIIVRYGSIYVWRDLRFRLLNIADNKTS